MNEAPHYHFVTRWRFDATIEEVADVLEDVDSLSRWWPSVYLDVRTVEPGGPHGLGRVVDLYTKGFLPYRLRWQFRVVSEHYPNGSRIEATGDFVGTGEWTLVQDGAIADVTYDWRIVTEKPLLRRLSWLLRPLFAANHRWAMSEGERALERELVRRRALRVHASQVGAAATQRTSS